MFYGAMLLLLCSGNYGNEDKINYYNIVILVLLFCSFYLFVYFTYLFCHINIIIVVM